MAAPPTRDEEISKRDRELLRGIIQNFIDTGEPVGSQAIAPIYELSSATVRSVMADLEALGYLEKPHTSAGRVPTEKGFRLYVNSLLRVRGLPQRERDKIEQQLHLAPLPELVRETGKLLHHLTRHASVVMAPSLDRTTFRRIEFVGLRDDRVLAILVSHEGLVQNRLISLDFPMGGHELEHATNYLNELLGELTLEQIHQRLRVEREAEQALYDQLRKKSLELAQRAFPDEEAHPELFVTGEASFLDEPSFAEDVETMRGLFTALAEKDRLLHILRRAIEGKEFRIFIGAESELSDVANVSVISAPYSQGDRILGTLAVIGPTRMNYARVIPLVDYTAKAVSRLFSSE